MGYAQGDGIATTAKIADDAVTLAKMAAGTDGNLITYDASGDPAAVATGTSGQVLTSGGAGVAPTFAAAAAGGAWTWLETQTASTSASLDFDTLIDSTYDEYVFVLRDVLLATDAKNLYMRISQDAGSTWIATGYDYHRQQRYQGVNTYQGEVLDGGTFWILAGGNNTSNVAGEGIHGFATIFNPAGAVKHVMTANTIYTTDTATNKMNYIVSGAYDTDTTAIDGVQFLSSSGNIASGSISMYGISKT
jgi:hypothetical protein